VASDFARLAYSVTEVRKLTGIGNTTLYRAIGSNELRAVKHAPFRNLSLDESKTRSAERSSA